VPTTQQQAPETSDTEIDLNAPAGSPSSLGAKSKRDIRPATDDSVVEAMDEAGPGVTPPLADDNPRP
jgi:hypothetical protein